MTATNQFAAHVGLDWADKKHDVCVQFKNGGRVFHVIEHTAEALDVWLTGQLGMQTATVLLRISG